MLLHFSCFQNDSAAVNLTVTDVNEWEPRFRYPSYDFYLKPNFTSKAVGLVEAADGDAGDRLNLTLSGKNASLFNVLANGEIHLKQQGKYRGTASFLVTAADNGSPPRRASVPVTVHFLGSGDEVSAKLDEPDLGRLVLAGLGVVLLILVFVVAVLTVYVYKV